MSAKIAKTVVDNLDNCVHDEDLGMPYFSREKNLYKTYPLRQENFIPINPVETHRKIAFVDGGNQEVIGAPNFSVQLNRVYFNIFEGGQRSLRTGSPNKIEFFSTTVSRFQNDEIFYDTSVIPLKEDFEGLLPQESDLSFSSFDPTFASGRMRAEISRVASVARRFAEWTFACHVAARELDEGDVLVLDGSLQTAFTNESKYSSILYDIAKKRGVIVSGLSKTSSLFTTTGLSLIGAMNKLAEDSALPHALWYFLVAEALSMDHNAAIFVVKLSPKAERIFRYEIYREQFSRLDKDELNSIIDLLTKNSQDISFPGYPYGLIDADKYARVSNDEVECYQALLLSEISKQGKWPKFSRHIHAMDAHSILNMIMG